MRNGVSLEEILRAREERAARQRQLLHCFGAPLISFTMNIPGPVKDSPLIRFAFRAGVRETERAAGRPLFAQTLCRPTGCEALRVYDRPAEELKALCLALEEGSAVGRLYDLDVIGTDGEKLSRPHSRRCIICGGPVTLCSRARAHGLAALEARTCSLLTEFAAAELGRLAEEALFAEVRFTPKPGLVDGRNSGAHRDMDLPLFEAGIRAIAPFLRRFAALGLAGAAEDALQQAGLEAERAMFAATGGVNTHKGAIYSLALLLHAAGIHLTRGGSLFALAADTAKRLPPPEGTNGSAVRLRYGVGGVRQEAVSGFPTLRGTLAALESGGPLHALVWSMAHLEDSTLYHRGGREGAAFVRQEAAALLPLSPLRREEAALALDRVLIARGLSPGGSADLLALALFLRALVPLLEENTL